MPARVRGSWALRPLGLVAAGLLLAAAGIHLDLYLTGYRNIPTIGPLFLVQVASAVVLSVAVIVTTGARSRSLTALAAGGAAAFALGTIAAYGVSRAGSLFGFHERPTAAGLVAGLLEVGAFAALTALAGVALGERARPRATTPAHSGTGHGGRRGGARRRRTVESIGLGAVSGALVALVLATSIGSPAPSVRSGHSPATTPRSGPVVHVVISTYAFHPARVLARPGETIAVTNRDQVTHTMTAVPGSVPFGRFDTGYVDPGRTVRIHAPRSVGSYQFYCSIHHFMKGVLVVSG